MSRIKLAYPKMPGSKDCPGGKCVAFEKYDGTNLHWVWEPELGWYAFGVRRHRYDLDDVGIREFNAAHPGMEQAVALFRSQLIPALDVFLSSHPEFTDDEFTVFTEFLGESSFAGMHRADDSKRLVLIDVQTSAGFLPPEEFTQAFKPENSARVVYRGKLTGQFIHDVREGRYDVNEGVVCKGVDRDGTVWMVKIKTHDYLRRLQEAFRSDWEAYWE